MCNVQKIFNKTEHMTQKAEIWSFVECKNMYLYTLNIFKHLVRKKNDTDNNYKSKHLLTICI